MAKRKLSKQQYRRIAFNQKNKTSNDNAKINEGLTITARVISHHGRKLVAEIDQSTRITCSIRQNLGEIACGDFVTLLQTESAPEKKNYVVVAVLPRKNLLEKTGFASSKKPVAANIDKVIIVSSIIPEPNTYLIDRYLVATENLPAHAVIVLNKIDLIHEELQALSDNIQSLYESIGYPVIQTSVKKPVGLDTLSQELEDNTSILVGLSGVGKSSLVKSLLPEENIRIGETSQSSGEGKHTTTVSSLYHLKNKGIIIDSPGVRDFTPINQSISEITSGFIDIRQFSTKCRFSNCTHITEPGCGVLAALKQKKLSTLRYNSYQQMIREFTDSQK